MPERDTEVFSNPLPPENHRYSDDEDEGHPLTNDDFRKMLMTPRGPGPAAKLPPQQQPIKTSTSSLPKKHISGPLELPKDDDEEDPATRRRKKKIYYAKLKRMEEEKQKELEMKYRDRAKERRDGSNRDYEETEIISTTADYRAVAPDVKAGENYAERRKQVIQESKYLGGDMEHTHLVKGLDFALLEKVRAEISNKEKEDEDAMETAVSQKKEEKPEVDLGPKIEFRTKMARNIYKILFQNKLPERNELFLPRRMAYVVDLEDEYADADVPTTIIRSKADCPTVDATTTLTTNDIVINKLTQILSYLRQGRRESKKLKKKEKGKLKEEEKAKLAGGEDNIYNDIGDYVPTYNKVQDKKDRKKDRREDRHDDRDKGRDRDRDRQRDREDHRRDRERDRVDRRDRGDRRDRDRRDRDRDRDDRKRKSYFEKPVEEDDDHHRAGQSASQIAQSINEKFKSFAGMPTEEEVREKDKGSSKLQKLKGKIDHYGYDECYPGEWQMEDTLADSDDEVDYSKMDQGNKKGPVGRWDFDTQEEYSNYMSNKEALPKAAFQYGVKMADGRKTRRAGPKDEKAELDKQWQKIQNILAKRKTGDSDAGGKRPKY